MNSPLIKYLGGVVFFGDEGDELGAEALHLLPPLPLDLLPLHCRRCAAAAGVVARAAFLPSCRRFTTASLLLHVSLSISS
jgi:hypothetical protein